MAFVSEHADWIMRGALLIEMAVFAAWAIDDRGNP